MPGPPDSAAPSRSAPPTPPPLLEMGGVKHQPEPPSRISRSRCQGSVGAGVKDQPEPVSGISRSRCQGSAGASVKDQPGLRQASGDAGVTSITRNTTICEVSVPVSRNDSGTYATSWLFLLGLPPGLAKAPNSLSLSCRARWVRSKEPVLCDLHRVVHDANPNDVADEAVPCPVGRSSEAHRP
jgi:hypothetical protein